VSDRPAFSTVLLIVGVGLTYFIVLGLLHR
jgi:hypothetical protein